MDASSIRNEIRPHNPRIIQENAPVQPRHQDRVSILRMDEAAVSEIGGIERARQPMARQGCQERPQAVRQVAREEARDGGEGLVGGADAGEARGGVCSFRDVC